MPRARGEEHLLETFSDVPIRRVYSVITMRSLVHEWNMREREREKCVRREQRGRSDFHLLQWRRPFIRSAGSSNFHAVFTDRCLSRCFCRAAGCADAALCVYCLFSLARFLLALVLSLSPLRFVVVAAAIFAGSEN